MKPSPGVVLLSLGLLLLVGRNWRRTHHQKIGWAGVAQDLLLVLAVAQTLVVIGAAAAYVVGILR